MNHNVLQPSHLAGKLIIKRPQFFSLFSLANRYFAALKWKFSSGFLSKACFVVLWHKWQAGEARDSFPHFTECDQIRNQFLQCQTNIIKEQHPSLRCCLWSTVHGLKAGQQNKADNKPWNLTLWTWLHCFWGLCAASVLFSMFLRE